MLGSPLRHRGESRADFDRLHGIDAHHGRSQIRIQLGINWSAPTHRHMLGDSSNLGADRIAGLAQLIHERLKLRHHVGVGREKRIASDGLPTLERHRMRTDLTQVAADHDTIGLIEPLPGDGRCGDTHCRLAGRRASPAPVVPNAVLLPVGIVGMAGPERIDQIAVVFAASVFVSDQQRDGGTGRLALEDPGQNLDAVGFLTLRDVARGAGLAAIEIVLDVFEGQAETGRAAVDHTADRRPMTLAERRDREDPAERIAGHWRRTPPTPRGPA